MLAVIFIWTLGFLLYPGSYGSKETGHQTDSCNHTLSCSECIQSHPSCVWCSAKNFTQGGKSEGSRCATRLELLQRGCDEGHLIDPKELVQFLKDAPLSDNADEDSVTQLAPQKVHIKLRPGEKTTFRVRFKRAEGYPIDLYYLMDLSFSMQDDLENVKKLGSDIQEMLHKVTKSVRIGFGSFVDKVLLPYVNTLRRQLQNPCPVEAKAERCQPPFSYRHVLSLTSNLTLFQQRVSAENISGNLDSPEGGFDAILQAAVCTDHIGWRNVTRLLVFATDDVFHMAGDGKLAGIYMPTDGRCHLNENGEYYYSHMFDYPSVGHISQVLTAANIQPIFAVTSNVLSTYQELSELIPKSAVGELKKDSSNVVNLISQAYNNLSSTVNLEHMNLPKGIHISYDSHCPNSTKEGTQVGFCSGVKINEMVDFNVTLWMDKKTCQDGLQNFKLRVLGFNEEINVDIEPVCHCDCKDEEAFSSYCSGDNGNYSCGICSCVDGYKGKHCECHQNIYDSNEGCMNGSKMCNGHGKCECGRCACNENVHGQFCECDDANCERYEGQLCGGPTRGVCFCDTCKCTPNYTGSACGCSLDTSACMTPDGICSRHGKCECNKCVCEKGYFNKLCSECSGCQTPLCQKYSACAECKAFTTGLLKENCTLHCRRVNVTMVKASEWSQKEKAGLCQEKREDSLITFHVTEDRDLVHILVKEKQDIQDHTHQLILGLVSGIVLFGLLIIILYRVIVEMYDRQEYRRFQKARCQEQWNDAQNPLYKSATTTVVNPNFIQE